MKKAEMLKTDVLKSVSACHCFSVSGFI